MNFLKNVTNVHNKITNYFHNRCMCILCIFWIVPFLAGTAIVWIGTLGILFGLSLFIPFFMPMFVLLSLAFALVNVVAHSPLLSVLFIAALWFFRDQILDIWKQLFIAKSCSIQKPLSNHAPMILLLFAIHGLVYIIPIQNAWKFAILALISACMFNKIGHKHSHCN